MKSPNIKNIKEEKATMIMENSVGITTMWHIWLKELVNSEKNKITVIYKEKGKRKLSGWSFPIDNKFCFADGWQNSSVLTDKYKSSFVSREMVSFDETFDNVCNEMENIIFLHKN